MSFCQSQSQAKAANVYTPMGFSFEGALNPSCQKQNRRDKRGPAPTPSTGLPPDSFVHMSFAESRDGYLNFPLVLDEGLVDFGDYKNVWTKRYNGTWPIQGISVKPGDRLTIPLTNDLGPLTESQEDMLEMMRNDPDQVPLSHLTAFHLAPTTNLHLHGTHIDPGQDNVYVIVAPGEEYIYTYDVPENHQLGVCVIHAHSHGSVCGQINQGLNTLLLFRGDSTYALSKIRTVPCLISLNRIEEATDDQKAQGADYQALPFDASYNDLPGVFVPAVMNSIQVLTVNGVSNPTLNAHVGNPLRLRLAWIASSDFCDLRILDQDGNRVSFYLTAIDSIELVAPRKKDSFLMANINRIDIVLFSTRPGTYTIWRIPYFEMGMPFLVPPGSHHECSMDRQTDFGETYFAQAPEPTPPLQLVH